MADDREDQVGTYRSDPETNEAILRFFARHAKDRENIEYTTQKWGYDVVKAESLVKIFSNTPLGLRRERKGNLVNRLNLIEQTGFKLKPISKMNAEQLTAYYQEVISQIIEDYKTDSGPLPPTPPEAYD